MQVHKIRLMFDISENGGLLRSNDAILADKYEEILQNKVNRKFTSIA